MKNKVLCIGSFLSAMLFFTNSVFASSLKVSIEGINSTKGQIVVMLFDSADTFMKPAEAIKKTYIKPIVGSSGEVEFSDLKSGQYAVFAYHDETDNDRFEVGFMGRPLEQFGLSGDFKRGSRPNFDEVSFHYTADEAKTVNVNFVH